MKNSDKAGIQPARAVLAERGMTITGVARIMRIKYAHVVLALRGEVPPAPVLRERLSAHLGVPIESLFTAELLEKNYVGPGPELHTET